MVSKFHTKNLYKFDEVTSAFQKEVRRGNLLPALFWGGELENSGYGKALYNRIFTIATEDISIGAPSLCIPLLQLYQDWQQAEDKSVVTIQTIKLLVEAHKNRVVNNALLYVSSFTEPPETIPDMVIPAHLLTIIDQQFHYDLFAGADDRTMDIASTTKQLVNALQNEQVLNALFFTNFLHMYWQCDDNRGLLTRQIGKKLTQTSKKLAANASMYSWFLMLHMAQGEAALYPIIETLYTLYIQDIGTPRLNLMMAVMLLAQYKHYDLSVPVIADLSLISNEQRAVFCNNSDDIVARRQFMVPDYALDKHTDRGKGNTSKDNNYEVLHQQGQKEGIDTRQWPIEEVAKSHGKYRWFAERVVSGQKQHSRMSHFFDVGAVITNPKAGIQGQDPYLMKARKFYLAIERKYGYRMAKSTQIIEKMFPLLLKNQTLWKC
ncbi:MAG TPA: hypothetical protein DCS93_05835 [Microscillaceae bacterium]|nr:hypothetical protein [Microscillaceae bacterium]